MQKSISYSQTEIIDSIRILYLQGNQIELDPMYSKGSMYGKGSGPVYKLDLAPMALDVERGNALSMRFKNKTINSMILDPPWLIHAEGSKSKMGNRFTTLPNKDSLVYLLRAIIKEAARVLKQDGILIFKIQDTIHNRRKLFLSHIVMSLAINAGFNPLDEFILIAKSRMRSKSQTGCISNAAHSWHCSFIVFRKKKSRTLQDITSARSRNDQ